MESLSGEFKKLTITTLETQHLDIFIRAVTNVLSSPIAEVTYAQIIDGHPLAEVAFDVYHGCVCPRHPLLTEHTELCQGVIEQTRELGTKSDPWSLQIDSKLVQEYQSAPPGSRVFATRLIELVTRAVHQAAVWLYKQDTSRHKNDALGRWRPAEEKLWLFPKTFPSILCRRWSASPDAIYFHPDKRDVIYRIYRLLDEQKQELRVDPESSIHTIGIYRDPWDRQLRSLNEGDQRVKDVVDTFNYLSFKDWREAAQRGRRERERRL